MQAGDGAAFQGVGSRVIRGLYSLRLITRPTETDEAAQSRDSGGNRERLHGGRTKMEQEVHCQREGERPRVEPASAVRGTCSPPPASLNQIDHRDRL